MNGNARAGPSRRPRYDTSAIPSEYEVNVPEDRAKNTFVFSEEVRKWGPVPKEGVDAGKRKKQRGQSQLVHGVRIESELTAT